ncbi:hypothetical protein LCGC14_1269000 [marine sediment metagenome]|uniref:Uncharacterized protein n=1 Tax=marine sediment metagenome TaxID=412755 RepID=A0A0F9P1T2_9ZZZZ
MSKKKTNKTKRSYEEPTEVSFRDHLKKKSHGS